MQNKRLTGTMSAKIVLVAVLCLIFLSLLAAFGQGLWIQGEPFYPKISSKGVPAEISGYLSVAITSFDQVISMLFTIEIGLFIMIGFILQGYISGDKRITWTFIIFLSVFFTFSFIAICLAYLARLQISKNVSSAIVRFDYVVETVALQALFVSLSGVVAFIVVSHSLLFTEKNEVTKEHQSNSESNTAVYLNNVKKVGQAQVTSGHKEEAHDPSC